MSDVNAQNLYLLEVESISSSVGSTLYGELISYWIRASQRWEVVVRYLSCDCGTCLVLPCVKFLPLFFEGVPSDLLLRSQEKDFSFGRRFLFVVIITMLMFDTLNIAISTYFVAHDIRSLGGFFQPDTSRILTLVDAILSKINVSPHWLFVSSTVWIRIYYQQFFLSDLVIIWRAWSIFERRTLFIKIILFFCVFVSLGKWQFLLALDWVDNWQLWSTGAVIADMILTLASSLELHRQFTLQYTTSRITLPLALLFSNVVATSFIANRAWWAHITRLFYSCIGISLLNRCQSFDRTFHRALDHVAAAETSRVHHLTQVLFLMAESGCLYSLLWVCDPTNALSDISLITISEKDCGDSRPYSEFFCGGWIHVDIHDSSYHCMSFNRCLEILILSVVNC